MEDRQNPQFENRGYMKSKYRFIYFAKWKYIMKTFIELFIVLLLSIRI